MTAPRVVFGRGMPALIAANALIARGEAVLWLDPNDGPAVEPSLDPAPWRADSADHGPLESILGELRPAAARPRCAVFDRRRAALPLGRRDRARLLGLDAGTGDLGSLLRARARNTVAEAIGGGQEERSYADWVCRRFGHALYASRFAGYAERRWGAQGASLSASTARWHHFTDHDAHLVEPAAGVAGCAARLLARFEVSGGQRRTRAAIRHLELVDGRIRGLTLEDGDALELRSAPWLQADPRQIVGWLGEGQVSAATWTMANALHNADRLLLDLPDDAAPASEGELHFLDEGPFWMARRAKGRCTLVGTVAAGAPAPEPVEAWLSAAARAGLRLHVDEASQIRRIAGIQPQWRPKTLAWLRDVLVTWDRVGLVAFGRAGTLADLDPAEQARYATLLTDGGCEQREAHRLVAEPAGSADDLQPSTGPLITR